MNEMVFENFDKQDEYFKNVMNFLESAKDNIVLKEWTEKIKKNLIKLISEEVPSVQKK